MFEDSGSDFSQYEVHSESESDDDQLIIIHDSDSDSESLHADDAGDAPINDGRAWQRLGERNENIVPRPIWCPTCPKHVGLIFPANRKTFQHVFYFYFFLSQFFN